MIVPRIVETNDVYPHQEVLQQGALSEFFFFFFFEPQLNAVGAYRAISLERRFCTPQVPSLFGLNRP